MKKKSWITILLLCMILLTSCSDIKEKESSATEKAETDTYKSSQETPNREDSTGQTEKATTEKSKDSDSADAVKIYYLDNDFISSAGFADGLAAVQDSASGLWGFIDYTGEYVIEPAYYGAYIFTEGLAAVNVDGKWGYIDKNGELKIAAAYDKVHSFSEGLAAVMMEDQWGYIDKNGELVISGIPYEPSDFTEGHAKIPDDYYGSKAIDKTGAVYDDSLLVNMLGIQMLGYNLVGTKNHLGSTVGNSYDANCILDENGTVIVDLTVLKGGEFSNCTIKCITDQYIVIEKGINGITTQALTDYEGNIILDFKYNELIPFEGNRFLLAQDADYHSYLIDVEGHVLREAEYTQKLYSTTTNFDRDILSCSPNIYGENLSAYEILSPLGGNYPKSALGTQYIEIFDNQTGEAVHNIYLEFLDDQARQSAKYLFLEKCFIAWNSPNFWIYDYNGNLLQELSSNDILQGLSSDNIYTNGNLFRMLGADYDPLLETLSPYYGSCGMFGGDFSDFDILMLPVIRDNKVTFLVIDNT